MPSLFRSISQRFRRSAKRRPNGQPGTSGYQMGFDAPEMDPKKQCQCKVMLLDGTDLNIVVSKNAVGQEVYDQVFYTLDLEERDYFGLLFMDHYHVQHWLDPLKKLSKQVPIGPPYTFRFNAKFYTSEPSNLREELTRYQFFLQLKQDIQTGKLACPRDIAIELAALALQSELGDYNPTEHTPALISEFRFHPEQNEEMELAILEQFMACRGQSPATAELNYLNKAKWIELYGVDMHTVEGKDGNCYRLGLTPVGCLVFDGNQKIGLFSWEKIQKLDFKNRKLTLVVEEDADASSGQVQLHTFVFNLTSHKACKHLWKCAIEHHTFFRLKFHHTKSRKSSLFRLGSTFKYRGRTEYENMHKDVGRLSRRQSSTFERRPSQRYGPRQTLINRRVQVRNEIKQQVAASIGLPISSAVCSSDPPESYLDTRKAEDSATTIPVSVNSSKVVSTVLPVQTSPGVKLNPSALPLPNSSDVKLSSTALPTVPLMNGKTLNAVVSVNDSLNRVVAAEARLETLIYNNDTNDRQKDLPPVVTKLNVSPQAAHRLMNGTKTVTTGNDILLNGHAEQKPDASINVQLSTKSIASPNVYPLLSPGHVTKIAINSNGSQPPISSRNLPSVTSGSRIPVYTYNNNNNNNNNNIACNAPSSCAPPTSPLSSSSLSNASDSYHLSCNDVGGQSLSNEEQIKSATNFQADSNLAKKVAKDQLLSAFDTNMDAKENAKVIDLLDLSSSNECFSSMQAEQDSLIDLPDILTIKNPLTMTKTVTSVIPSSIPSSTLLNAAKASTNLYGYATSLSVATKEKDKETNKLDNEPENEISKETDRLKRSRLPVRSTTSITTQEAAKKIPLDEKLSQSRIPKMASGSRPTHYFGHHGEKVSAGGSTYIPIIKTGIPTSQSRVITDL